VHYALRRAPVRLASRLPVWMCGVLAALATAGVAAALASLVPMSTPSWPDQKAIATWWPPFNAIVSGIALVPAAAMTLFLLSVFDRITYGWSRRVGLVALLLVLLGVAVGIVSGQEIGQALLQGAVQGVTAFLFAWLVMRYDLRAVPPFVATGLVLEAVRRASLVATPSAWLMCVVTAVVAIAFAAWVVRFISANAAADDTTIAPRPA